MFVKPKLYRKYSVGRTFTVCEKCSFREWIRLVFSYKECVWDYHCTSLVHLQKVWHLQYLVSILFYKKRLLYTNDWINSIIYSDKFTIDNSSSKLFPSKIKVCNLSCNDLQCYFSTTRGLLLNVYYKDVGVHTYARTHFCSRDRFGQKGNREFRKK